MPSYMELLKWIREGKTSAQIMELFEGHPYQLRRALNSKRLREQLRLDEQLAAAVASHKTAACVSEMANRLAELAEGTNVETARKAALALLSEGTLAARTDAQAQHPAQTAPAQLLVPLEQISNTSTNPSTTPTRTATEADSKANSSGPKGTAS